MVDKEHEGILSTAQNAVVDTAKAGFEGAKNLAESVGTVVSDTALVGFEGAKKLAVSAGSTVTDAVSALAKARKTVRAKPAPKKRPASKVARKKTKAAAAKPRCAAKRKTVATRAKRVARRDWTAQEERTLRKHSKSKTPVKGISKALKRTAGALRQKARALGISLGERRSKRASAR
ncbi:MAG: hypothetical protein ACLQF1_19730 [Methyloceanibacter sp.]